MELMLPVLFTCITLFLLSACLTQAAKNYALHKKLLDMPNERSSHHIPTPRLGGMAIVLAFTLCLLGLYVYGYMEQALFLALFGGGSVVALIGYYDDIYKIKTIWRITIHFLAAAWTIYCLGGFTLLDLGTWQFVLNEKGPLLVVVAIVWLINLYNFMDGIDGLSGSEGVFVSLSCSIGLCLSHHFALAAVLLFLAVTIAGFTVWNWPPAAIFLGDAGSGYLGYLFGAFSFYTAKQGALPISFWLIVLAVFWCDATFTLLCRLLQGKRWYAAHREHAYQALIAEGMSHRQVTLAVMMINVFILFPLAMGVLYDAQQAGWFLISVVTALLVLWSYIRLTTFSLSSSEGNI